MATQPAQPEHLFTPAEVAALVFVDPKTVSRWARAGRLPSTTTPGGHRRFRGSDVQALVSYDSSQRESRGAIPAQRMEMGPRGHPDAAVARTVDHSATDAVVADAVAVALEGQAEAAAEAVQETAAAVTLAAETAAAAAGTARRARAFAAARIAATVQAAAVVASADTAGATAGVAQAASDAAENVAVILAAFDLAVERETAASAEALHNLTEETARHVARRNEALVHHASSLRRPRT